MNCRDRPVVFGWHTFLCAVLVSVSTGCSREGGDAASVSVATVTSERIDSLVRLDDSNAPLSDVRAMAAISGGFVVASAQDAGVALFAASGQPILRLGAWGEGPGEYLTPEAVSIEDSVVRVWDSKALKLLSFHMRGEFLGDVRFASAASDIDVESGRILMSHAGSPSRLVSVSDIGGEQLWRFGRPGYADMLLGIMAGAGRVTLHDQFGWFASPGLARLYRVNLDNWVVDSLDIVDDAFNVATPAHVSEPQDIVSKWGQSIEYMSTNSRVVGVHQVGALIAVEVEHGRIPSPSSNANTRWSRVHFYDQQMRFVATLDLPADVRQRLGGAIAAADSEHLYFARSPSDQDDKWLISAVAVPGF